jgi:tetratricopeptide (TPR) repeat protein
MGAKAILSAVLLGGLLAGQAALGQTPGAELDRLFARLRDPAAAASAPAIESRIWNAWMNGGSAVENDTLRAATEAMARADFATAENLLNALVSATDTFPEAFNKRATLYFLMGRFDDSLADIVRTLELEPRHFGALSGRGMILQRLGRDAEAIAAFKEALDLNPAMPGAKSALQQLEGKAPRL